MTSKTNATFLCLAALVCTLSACAPRNAKQFDQLCVYFDELKQQPNEASMTPSERHEFIGERFTAELPEDAAPWMAWQMVSYAEPERRYELFKEAADEATGGDWECESMKELASRTGESE